MKNVLTKIVNFFQNFGISQFTALGLLGPHIFLHKNTSGGKIRLALKKS